MLDTLLLKLLKEEWGWEKNLLTNGSFLLFLYTFRIFWKKMIEIDKKRHFLEMEYIQSL